MANNTEDDHIRDLTKLVDDEMLEAVNSAVTYRESGMISTSAYEVFMNNHIEVATEKVVKAIASYVQQEANKQKRELLDRLENEFDGGRTTTSVRLIKEVIRAERKQLEEKDISQRTSDGRRIKNGWNPRGEML